MVFPSRNLLIFRGLTGLLPAILVTFFVGGGIAGEVRPQAAPSSRILKNTDWATFIDALPPLERARLIREVENYQRSGSARSSIARHRQSQAAATVSKGYSNAVPRSRRSLVQLCHGLGAKKLKYVFGSDNPAKGGLDCSGTVQYLYRKVGIAGIPRQSNMQYAWLEGKGTLTRIGRRTSSTEIFKRLLPGDLLFWENTYETKRTPPITHVMIYLGYDRRTRKHKMFGARGSKAKPGLHGGQVDVFDWNYPKPKLRGKFVAFGRVPGLR